jgi:hypothetical protein
LEFKFLLLVEEECPKGEVVVRTTTPNPLLRKEGS